MVINSSGLLFVECNQLFCNMSVHISLFLVHLNREKAGLCFASHVNYSVHRVIVNLSYIKKSETVTSHIDHILFSAQCERQNNMKWINHRYSCFSSSDSIEAHYFRFAYHLHVINPGSNVESSQWLRFFFFYLLLIISFILRYNSNSNIILELDMLKYH